jgi:hypothetical protein
VITNEIGQHNDDPNQTTAVMGKVVELGLPIAVWFSVDAPKARGLVNPDGSCAHRRGVPAFYRVHFQMITIAADGLTSASSRPLRSLRSLRGG